MFCLVGAGFWGGAAVFADTNDFYFSDFTGDYYLSKDAEGVSHLKVVESVTAVFPEFDQNKGICRQIPYTNYGDQNITLPRLTRNNLKITRNGVPEPIYSIEREEKYYNVCTGTEDYVLGEQTYVFEYQFEKVVTEFSEGGRIYQELYWDTNGNDSLQRFDAVTARLHFEDPAVYTGESWCYVGLYGQSGQDRCVITQTADGVEFSAVNLRKGENLTFDVELRAGSFVVPALAKNYICVILTVIVVALSFIVMAFFWCKYRKVRDKAEYYKSIFVKPEYQPSDQYRLTELAEIYLGRKKNVNVAMLLEMIVKKHVELKKVGKKKWSVLVKNLDGLAAEDVDFLAILKGGDKPEEGEEIEIKRQSASSKLIKLKEAMDDKILASLKADGLAEKKYKIGDSSRHGVSGTISMVLTMVPMMLFLGAFVLVNLRDALGLDMVYGQEMVFAPGFYLIAMILVVVTTIVGVVLNNLTKRYTTHTKAGLAASRYMEGLKLYIGMAEAKRLQFLQSVEGAEISAAGMIKLYEKLLPYAAVFGLEKSWMKEMQKYCEIENVEVPDYLLGGFTIASFSDGLNSITSSIGSASSSFSGGGGGGFSGGGGGGGGFSGR